MERTVKTIRETTKTWGLMGVETLGVCEKEFNRLGKLIFAKDYQSSEYSMMCSTSQGDNDIEDYPEHNHLVKQSFDDEGRLVEKQRWDDDVPLIERHTYDAGGREVAFYRKEGDKEYLEEYTYFKDEDGLLYKIVHFNGEEDEHTLQVIDSEGRIIYDTLERVDDNDEYYYEIFRYVYDKQGRLTDIYSYTPDSNSGEYEHRDYLEENGTTKTIRTVRPMYTTAENSDLLANSEFWEIDEQDEMIIEKETISEWKDKSFSTVSRLNELTGEEEKTTEYFDDDGILFKKAYISSQNNKVESKTVFLYDQNGHVIDHKSYHDSKIVLHIVNHYSDDGFLLFETTSLFKEDRWGGTMAEEMFGWYDYTFFD